MSYTINEPIPFNGTEQERRANYGSHDWTSFNGEIVCFSCDCKPWYESSYYPCGVDVPRRDRVVG
jgi:hypothetical protein